MFFRVGKETLGLIIVLFVVLGVMAGIGADKVPSPWFDEGWTLVVARNWVEQGKYSINMVDKYVSAAPMSHAFSVTIPVAASFRLLGVGVWQGRLPSMMFTIGILIMQFVLAKQMYNWKTAWATLAILILLAPQVSLNPLLFGRQVLGETSMLFYLLLGYWGWIQTLRGSRYGFVLASIFWGLALITKRQVIPFWLAAMLVPLVVSSFRRDWQVMKAIIKIGLGVGFTAGAFLLIESGLVGDAPSNGPFPVQDLFNLASWVTVSAIRLSTPRVIFRIGIFSLLGLTYCTRTLFQRFRQTVVLPAPAWCELSLIVLAGSWTFWYLFGSLGWPRYYYPIFVLTATFYAKLLVDWTGEFSQWPTPKLLQNNRVRFWKALIALTLIILNLGFVFKSVEFIPAEADRGVYQVSEYFHTNIETGKLVETYESELIFLLDQRIHYPPDKLQIDLNKRTFLNQPVSISYNPLVVNPDYLVIGPRGEDWQLYEPLVQSGAFNLIEEFTGYRIYVRAH